MIKTNAIWKCLPYMPDIPVNDVDAFVLSKKGVHEV